MKHIFAAIAFLIGLLVGVVAQSQTLKEPWPGDAVRTPMNVEVLVEKTRLDRSLLGTLVWVYTLTPEAEREKDAQCDGSGCWVYVGLLSKEGT